jgi:hypothetical protein
VSGMPAVMLALSMLLTTPARADGEPAAGRVELVAPHGFHMRADVRETARGSVVDGQVCRDGGSSSANPSVVRSFRRQPASGDLPAGWTPLSRVLRSNDFGCAFFRLTLSPDLARGESLRLVAE